METETVNRPATPPAIQRSTTSWIGTIALIILLIGGLNWALVGLFSFDLVAALVAAALIEPGTGQSYRREHAVCDRIQPVGDTHHPRVWPVVGIDRGVVVVPVHHGSRAAVALGKAGPAPHQCPPLIRQ